MARLTIEQVDAPDFSASAELMRGANASFNKGMESAQGILTQYNAGQQAKDDMKAIELIAQQRNEGELDTLLASGQLGKLNLSDTLRGNVSNLRGDVIGNVNDRDSNSRANANESRTASEHIDMVAARAERRSMTPAAVAAFNEANTYGTAGAPAEGATANDREILARTLQAEAAGEGYDGMIAAGAVIRNRAASGKYGGSNISDVIMKPGQFSAWNAVTGYAGGEGAIDMENLKVSDNAYAAADAILSGDYEDKTGGATHYYNPNVADPAWGSNKAGGNWTNIGNHRFGNPDGGGSQSASGPAPGYDPNAITSVGIGGKGYQDFSTKVAGSLYMDPTEATALLSGALTEQRATDARITAAEQLRQTELGQQAQLDAINNPKNTSIAEVQQDLAKTPGLNAATTLGIAGANYDAYGNIIAPAVKANPQVTAAAELAAAEASRSNELDPTIQAFEEAKAYEAADGGAGAALTANLGEAATGILAPENVNRQLEAFAKANNITAGEAAVVFNSVAQGNPEQLAAQIEAASDTDMFASLSSIAGRMFGDEARSAYQDGQLSDVASGAQRDAIQANILVAKTEAAKLPPGSSKKAAAEENIRLLEVGSIAANQPQKTKAQTAAYLGIEPAQMAELSPEDKKAAEDSIRGNQDLSVEEKTLLIMGLRL